MKSLPDLLGDTRHLWVFLFLIVVGGAGFLSMRDRVVPESFGQYGPYRGAALDEIAARPSVVQADSVCLKCHTDVGEERVESLHSSVRCIHCHGLGREHVAQARKAADAPSLTVSPAEEWDGDFLTHIDLYVSQDRALCLACHEATVGMPEDFKMIDVAEHLEEMEAEAPEGRETCFECHGGHDTAP
jgi:hypothetical protein